MKILKKQYQSILLVIYLMLGLSLNAWGNQNSNSEILRNTIIETENQLSESNFNHANNYSNSAGQLNGIDAWVDDSGLKWSTSNVGDFEAQKLSFEVKLKNSQQIRAERQILKMGQAKVSLKLASLLEKRLGRTYLSLIDYIAQKKRKNLLKLKRNLANSELNIWKTKVHSNDFSANKLQQVDLTLDSIWADELDNNVSLRRYERHTYSNQYDKSNAHAEQSRSSVISIPQMIKITKDIIQSEAYQQHNASIRKVEFSIDLANKQNQRDIAQEKISLNAVKLEYDNKNNDLGFSIGIKMPITKNSYESLLREQELRNVNIDAQHSIIVVSEQLNEKQFELMATQDQWINNQKLLHKINARITRLSNTNNIDLILALKQKHLQRRIRQEEIQERALKEYVNFLNIAGMLSAKPYRNWIEAGTPQIL